MVLSWGSRLCYLTLHYSNGRKQGRQIDPHVSTDVFYLNKLLNFISILNWIFGIKWRRACPMCPGAPWVIICRAFSVLNRHLHYLLSLLSTGIYMVRWGPPRPLSRLGSAGTGIVMFRTPMSSVVRAFSPSMYENFHIYTEFHLLINWFLCGYCSLTKHRLFLTHF